MGRPQKLGDWSTFSQKTEIGNIQRLPSSKIHQELWHICTTLILPCSRPFLLQEIPEKVQKQCRKYSGSNFANGENTRKVRKQFQKKSGSDLDNGAKSWKVREHSWRNFDNGGNARKVRKQFRKHSGSNFANGGNARKPEAIPEVFRNYSGSIPEAIWKNVEFSISLRKNIWQVIPYFHFLSKIHFDNLDFDAPPKKVDSSEDQFGKLADLWRPRVEEISRFKVCVVFSLCLVCA